MSISRANRSGIKPSSSPKKTRSLTDASGIPGPVQNLSSSVSSNTQVDLSWSAPEISGDSSVTSYIATADPGGTSASTSGTSVSLTGLTPGTAYTFSVVPVNSVGRGFGPQGAGKTTTAWNDASGGTVSTVSNYNGSGETWKVHQFSSTGTFTVNYGSTEEDFRVLVVGNGGHGRYGDGCGTGNGGAGGAGESSEVYKTIAAGSYTASITSGGSGSNTSFTGISMRPGGLGGNSYYVPPPGGSFCAGGGTGTSYPTSNRNITGTTISYARPAGSQQWPGGGGAANRGSTGGGQNGGVIVAYRIG